MKKIFIIALLFFASCTVVKPRIDKWLVTEVSVNGKYFRAIHGKYKSWFAVNRGDSVYVGKLITVSVGK